jgi:carbonic anhydrase
MAANQVSRRRFIAGLGTAAGATALSAGCGSAATSATSAEPTPTGQQFPHPETPGAALAILREGNQRYRNGQLELRDFSAAGEDIASSQSPFAAIITCADSRISPPLVFDVAHGNVFVSRVAGNTLDVGTLGSTEYAVAKLGVKLILVLGHSDCGAVKAALGVVDGTAHFPPDHYGSIGAVVDAIVPTIKSLPADQRSLATCTQANATAQAKAAAATPPVIKEAVAAGKIEVVSAVYDIASGMVAV